VESKANYTLVGLMVLILMIGFFISALWLSVGFEHKNYNTYLVYMDEAASGLNQDSVVKYNGVNVGYVHKITLNPSNPEQVKLKLYIESSTPMTIGTQASLVMQGITGTTYLGLSATSTTFKPLVKLPGEKYPVIPYKRSFFSMLEKSIEELSTNMNRVFNAKNANKINEVMNNLSAVSGVIKDNNRNIDKSLSELPGVMLEIKNTLLSFTGMAADVSSAGKNVSSTMLAGRNSIDQISQQALPPAVSLLRKLDGIANNLAKITQEMQQNPAIIIRGSAPQQPGPGEKR